MDVSRDEKSRFSLFLRDSLSSFTIRKSLLGDILFAIDRPVGQGCTGISVSRHTVLEYNRRTESKGSLTADSESSRTRERERESKSERQAVNRGDGPERRIYVSRIGGPRG